MGVFLFSYVQAILFTYRVMLNDTYPSSLYRNAPFLNFIHLILKYNKEPITEMKGETYNDLLGRR